MADQMELERRVAQHPAGAGVKTLLLHVQTEKTLNQPLEAALSLARACDAHLSCLHVTPIQAYTALDSFGGIFIMEDVLKAMGEGDSELRDRIEAKLSNAGVSWDYTQITGDVPSQVIGRAALTDLIVTSRQPKRTDFQGATIGLLGDLLNRSRTPLLIAADEGKVPDPTGPAMIAWNGSMEAANAVRSAVGLLKISSDVKVVSIEEDKDEAFPATTLLEYLSRHGIHAELNVETARPEAWDDDYPYACLISKAEQMNAAYVVMGGYSHSRISEFMFGGLTRSMLAGSPVPVFIAH
jgi:nucleotide-binding universal stress UspA family protein